MEYSRPCSSFPEKAKRTPEESEWRLRIAAGAARSSSRRRRSADWDCESASFPAAARRNPAEIFCGHTRSGGDTPDSASTPIGNSSVFFGTPGSMANGSVTNSWASQTHLAEAAMPQEQSGKRLSAGEDSTELPSSPKWSSRQEDKRHQEKSWKYSNGPPWLSVPISVLYADRQYRKNRESFFLFFLSNIATVVRCKKTGKEFRQENPVRNMVIYRQPVWLPAVLHSQSPLSRYGFMQRFRFSCRQCIATSNVVTMSARSHDDSFAE